MMLRYTYCHRRDGVDVPLVTVSGALPSVGDRVRVSPRLLGSPPDPALRDVEMIVSGITRAISSAGETLDVLLGYPPERVATTDPRWAHKIAEQMAAGAHDVPAPWEDDASPAAPADSLTASPSPTTPEPTEPDALQTFAAAHGLTIEHPSDHHVQVRKAGKVVADWWPSKGTVRAGSRKGPTCKTEAELVAWLKEQV